MSLGSSIIDLQVAGWIILIYVGRPKDVVVAMIKRLAHRNANVQLYTLEVRYEVL